MPEFRSAFPGKMQMVKLFERISFRGVELANRIVVSVDAAPGRGIFTADFATHSSDPEISPTRLPTSREGNAELFVDLAILDFTETKRRETRAASSPRLCRGLAAGQSSPPMCTPGRAGG